MPTGPRRNGKNFPARPSHAPGERERDTPFFEYGLSRRREVLLYLCIKPGLVSPINLPGRKARLPSLKDKLLSRRNFPVSVGYETSCERRDSSRFFYRPAR